MTYTTKRQRTDKPLEKTAFDPLHMALMGVGGHLAQNAAAAGLAKKSRDWVPNYLLARSLGGHGAGGGGLWAAGRGIGRAAVPEYGIMGDELAHAGSVLRGRLAARNEGGRITNRQLVNIRRALSGDFAGVAANSRNREDLLDVLETLNPEAVPAIRYLAAQAEKSPEAEQRLMDFLTDLGREYRANGFLGSIGGNMADRRVFNAKNLRALSEPSAAGRADSIEHGAENMANAALLWNEPGVGMFNVGKKALSSRKPAELAAQGNATAQKAKDAQDLANRVFVTEPMKQSFRRGLSGQDPTLMERSKDFVRTYGMNYPIGKVNEFSRHTGRLLNKHYGLTPERLDQLNAMSRNPAIADALRTVKAKATS